MLRDEEVRQSVKTNINENLGSIAQENADININETWNNIKKAIMDGSKEKLKPKNNSQAPKEQWMTDEILEIMEKRRQYKDKDRNKYREIQKEMRRKII